MQKAKNILATFQNFQTQLFNQKLKKMKQLQRMVNVKPSVKNLLAKFSSLRDSDRLLVAELWKQELKALKTNDLLMMLKAGKLTSYDSITRVRRKVQEENKNLRGKLYKERKAIGKQVKMNIKNVL
jgi:hypothetical protein